MPPSPPAARLLHGRGRLLDGAAVRSPWALLVGSDGRIAWAGTDPQDAPDHVAERTDLGAALVTPGLVDAHTHPVFAGDRADEAAARLEGAPYSGGGILRTMAATRAASNEELEALVEARLRAAVTAGTTTVECKSGYGLSLDEELRALRIVGRVAERLPVRVVRTFLGAHAVPPDASSPDAYVAEVCEAMIPAVAAEGLADFVDAFCDEGFFSVAHLELIGAAARASGLGLRVHAEQLARTGATEAAIRAGATSVDHLEQLDATGRRGARRLLDRRDAPAGAGDRAARHPSAGPRPARRRGDGGPRQRRERRHVRCLRGDAAHRRAGRDAARHDRARGALGCHRRRRRVARPAGRDRDAGAPAPSPISSPGTRITRARSRCASVPSDRCTCSSAGSRSPQAPDGAHRSVQVRRARIVHGEHLWGTTAHDATSTSSSSSTTIVTFATSSRTRCASTVITSRTRATATTRCGSSTTACGRASC